MLDYEIRPIGVWPGPRIQSRKRSAFKIVETNVLRHLEREIGHLSGKQIVFRLAVREQDIRQDGMLRATARPTDPGVIVEFTADKLKGSPRLLYRCDTFSNWWHNLSAIARALEALRMVDRYGVTPTGEQYAGFKALPSNTAPTMSASQAADVIVEHGSVKSLDRMLRDREYCKVGVRSAIFATHPDRNNGDRTNYDAVEVARRVLSSHHGVSL